MSMEKDVKGKQNVGKREGRPVLKHSLKKQIALVFILLMSSVILMCWLVNTLFLEKYYMNKKTKVIYNAYAAISNAAASDSYNSSEFQKELDKICSKYNIAIFVMDSNSQMKYVSENGGEKLELLLFGYIFGVPMEKAYLIEEGEDYIIQRSGKSDSGNLEMYGRLASGISFMMRTPLESIKESAQIANTFFFYVGLAGAVSGGIIIWIVVGKISKPILELNRLSEKMVHLDFDAKYEGTTHTEIDILGENMNKLSESLEKSISELKTANNELLRDIEKKEKNDQMRKEFLANVSHELKTPIALIRGYAEGLQEGMGEDPEDRDYYCEVIVDEATKMNMLVQKLLTLNQLEFGQNTVNMERFDLYSLIQNELQSGRILAQQQGIQVELEEASPMPVWADEFMVEEVFQNYFSNAIHHCSGEKRIIIRFAALGQKIRTEVFNTGEKIPEESLPLLWDKFYKVDKARTREYGGSGVGLSIVKVVMDSLNQTYGVENRENGVCFWFELESADCEGV